MDASRARARALVDASSRDEMRADARARRGGEGTSSTAQATVNAVNILCGVGTLSVPFALAESGWSGLLVLAVLGWTTNYTGKILIACQREGSLPVEKGGGGRGAGAARRALTSYEDIGEAAFGKAGRALITAVLYTELIGTAGLFFILEGSHLATLFHAEGREEAFACAAASLMIPTAWLLDLSSLSYVGALGLGASATLTMVVSLEFFQQLFTTGTLPHVADTVLVKPSTLPVSFGLLAFVYAGHAVFPAIYSSMEKPEEYEEMLDRSYAVVALNCVALGVCGYLLFGDTVADQVTLSLPAGALATFAFALTTINPFTKFALTLDPVSKGVDDALGLRPRDDANDAAVSRLLRTALGGLTLAMAIKLPFFGVGMSLLGAALTLGVSAMFPSACYLKLFGDALSPSERALNWAILAGGALCAASGTIAAIQTAVAAA